jgi:DNA-binding transcriptional LysR family regulator
MKRHGTPRLPRDLKGHRIGWYSGYPTRERLAFHGPGETVSLDLDPVLLTNSVHLLRDYALEHAGIVCVPTLVASEAVLSGALRLVLPEHQLSSFWLSIFYPVTVRSSLKLKLFLEMITASFSGVPPWDQALIERGLIAAEIIE